MHWWAGVAANLVSALTDGSVRLHEGMVTVHL